MLGVMYWQQLCNQMNFVSHNVEMNNKDILSLFIIINYIANYYISDRETTLKCVMVNTYENIEDVCREEVEGEADFQSHADLEELPESHGTASSLHHHGRGEEGHEPSHDEVLVETEVSVGPSVTEHGRHDAGDRVRDHRYNIWFFAECHRACVWSALQLRAIVTMVSVQY